MQIDSSASWTWRNRHPLRIDREGANAKFSAGANDAANAISPRFAIKTFLEHITRSALRLPIPAPRQATGLPYNKRAALPHAIQHLAELHRLPISATTSAITPFVSALISFITFIASIIHTTVSSVTSLPTSTKAGASRRSRAIKCPHHRRNDIAQVRRPGRR